MQDLLSVGFISQMWQESPKIVEVMLRGVQAEPVLSLNGVKYYRIEDVAMAHHLVQEHDAKQASEATSDG
jgi:hypothetical protein